ncbi:unnamed protein product [Zymoseptoria tritici ST99CH_1E4]|uniref:Uncharacterized protein n=2 Tax=Zymoseptoria tritici TaxID=1047171 RepID=A0A2H1GUM7_ZYMTR|nr:unnamed protein product [Zymoseptoria tritici ST99CH_1E4]
MVIRGNDEASLPPSPSTAIMTPSSPASTPSLADTTERADNRRRPADGVDCWNEYSTKHTTLAQDIDCGMLRNGHCLWGFVIYRTTYTSHLDWDQCLHRLRHQHAETLAFDHAADLLESNPFTVFDDATRFENATAAEIRQHFNEWCNTAPMFEQGTLPHRSGVGAIRRDRYGSPRYRLCISIDEGAMRSIINDDSDSWLDSKGYVNLIRGAWRPQPEEELQEEARLYGRSSPKMWEAVEGVTQEDVGWCRISYAEVVMWYHLFGRMHEGDLWGRSFRRWPEVVRCW